MVKLWYINTMEYYSVIKRNKLHNNSDGSQRHYVNWKKSKDLKIKSKDDILYESTNKTFSKWQRHKGGKSIKSKTINS